MGKGKGVFGIEGASVGAGGSCCLVPVFLWMQKLLPEAKRVLDQYG